MKTLCIILIFIFCVENYSSALYERMRTIISEINIELNNNKLPRKSDISRLNKLIYSINKTENLEENKKQDVDYIIKVNELFNSFKTFNIAFKKRIEVDSLKKIFRNVNSKFNSIAGNYFYKKVIKSTKMKIIFFSTSMSCECTLDMCYQQESEIQKLYKNNFNKFEYATIDCFGNFELMSEYGIGYIPVAIIADSNNNEIKRFERDENLFNNLLIFFNGE